MRNRTEPCNTHSGPHLRGARTNYPFPATRAEGRKSVLDGFEPSVTNQAGLHESDVNNVVLRYAGTGVLPPRLNPRTPIFEDVSDVPDLHTALSRARGAQLDLLEQQVLDQAAASEQARASADAPDAEAPPSVPSTPSGSQTP